MNYGPQTRQQFQTSLTSSAKPSSTPAPKPALIPKAAAADFKPPVPQRSNLYQTPAFLEDQRRQGISPNMIADFISQKVASTDPDFVGLYNATKQKYRNNPDAIDRFLNYKIYGTPEPDQSIIAQPLTPEEEGQEPEPGFFGRMHDRMYKDAAGGVRQALDDYQTGKQGPLDTTLQVAGNLGRGVLAPATETISTVSDAVGLTGAIQKGVETVASSPIGQAAAPAVQGAADLYQQAKEANPQMAKTFESVAGFVGDAAEVYGAGKTLQGIKASGKKAVQGTKEFFDSPPPTVRPPQVTDDVVQKLVQPKATKAAIQEAGVKNPELIKKGGLLRKGELLPDKAELELAKTAKKIPGFGQTDDVVQNANVVHKAKATKSKELLAKLKENDAVLSHKEMNSAINKAIEKIADDFPGEEAQIRRIGQIWKNEATKYPGKASGHWESRIGFDDLVESRYGETIFQKGTARAEAVRAVRQTANEMIDKAAQGKFKPQIKEIGDMYDIMDNLSTKMGDATLRSQASNFLRSPAGKTTAKVVGTGVVGAAGINLLKE